KGEERIERPAADLCGPAVDQELASTANHRKAPKFNGFPEVCLTGHGPYGTPRLFQNKPARAKDCSGARSYGEHMVERRTRMFLDRLATEGGKPLEQLSPLEVRQMFVDIQSGVPVDRTTTEVVKRTINVGQGIVKLTVVRPTEAVGFLPAFMFFPGGGWMF